MHCLLVSVKGQRQAYKPSRAEQEGGGGEESGGGSVRIKIEVEELKVEEEGAEDGG